MKNNIFFKIMLIYRYRSAKKYNIDAFCGKLINGSLFETFETGLELNIEITKTILEKCSISDAECKRILDVLIDNIKKKYYLACFTENEPFNSKEMWEKYASNGNGFCLEYDSKDIDNSIRFYNPKKILFKKVIYKEKAYCIDSIIDWMCSYSGVRKELENDDLNAAILKTPRNISKQAVDILINKKIEYKIEKEYRVILQKILPNGYLNNSFKQNMLIVKPMRIIISKGMNVIDIHKLVNAASMNGIPFIIIDNPCNRMC